jgi:hypothetical protein
MKFNPPPNWPPPSPGWSPPPGWHPDPLWPPPPPGWRLWVDDHPWYGRTWLIVLTVILFMPLGLPLLWLRSDWSLRLRGGVTAAIGALLLVAALTSPQPAREQTASQDRSAPPTTTATTTARPSQTVRPRQAERVPSTKPRAPSAKPRPHHKAVAAVHPAPRPRPVAPPTCGAPANPYRLNLCGRGQLVNSPPFDVCSYFPCIPNFDNGKGYMTQCNDGMYSMSGGRPGTCSFHHGEGRAVSQG